MSQSIILSLINSALSENTGASFYLQKLRGTTAEINIASQNFKKSFWLTFDEHGIQPINALDKPATVTISGPIRAFLNLAFHQDIHAAVGLGLTFSGDNSVLETLQALWSRTEVDWEEYVSQWTGDIISYQLSNGMRYAKKRKSEVLASTCQNISEYLTEEIRYFPTRLKTNYFMNTVDSLHKDVERLALRINQLCAAKS